LRLQVFSFSNQKQLVLILGFLIATAKTAATSSTWKQKVSKRHYDCNTYFHFSSFNFERDVFSQPKLIGFEA